MYLVVFNMELENIGKSKMEVNNMASAQLPCPVKTVMARDGTVIVQFCEV